MQAATDVLVVGGGPVGLMLAGELQRRGIRHLLIDELPQPAHHCKALGVTPRTLEVWQQIGVLEEALRAGLFLAGMTAAVNDREAETERVELSDMPYGFLLLAQYDTERILRQHLQRHGGRVLQGAALVGFDQHADGVRARVATGEGEQVVDCLYVVGCDGAHSAVRKGMGMDYAGQAYPMTFMLGDVRVHWQRPRPYGYRFTLTRDGELQNVLVCIPVPGDPQRYRLSLAAPPEYWEEGADLQTSPPLELLAQSIAPLAPAGTTISDLRWSSFYRISHRIVPSYRSGRAFLAGDAAHIHPPIGGQGMNTGLQDAHNLAWKLALAVRGRAAADLLDSYDVERRPVGQDVVDRTTRRMDGTLQDGSVKFDQWKQDSQLLIHYRGTGWVGQDVAGGLAQGPQPGDCAPEARGLRREWVADPLRLTELLRTTAHTLLLYFDAAAPPELYAHAAELSDALQRRCGDDVIVYGIASPAARVVDRERLPLLTDAGDDFRRAYGAGGPCLYLIRPDGHIGYRSDRIDARRLDAHLQRIFAGGAPSH